MPKPLDAVARLVSAGIGVAVLLVPVVDVAARSSAGESHVRAEDFGDCLAGRPGITISAEKADLDPVLAKAAHGGFRLSFAAPGANLADVVFERTSVDAKRLAKLYEASLRAAGIDNAGGVLTARSGNAYIAFTRRPKGNQLKEIEGALSRARRPAACSGT